MEKVHYRQEQLENLLEKKRGTEMTRKEREMSMIIGNKNRDGREKAENWDNKEKTMRETG